MPSVIATALRPSSSGRPAATSAPKAMTRMSSVIGSERVSAFLKSSSRALLSALFALASPNCSMRNPGWRRWAAATAVRIAPTRFSALSWSPRRSKFTSALRRSREIWPSSPTRSGSLTLRTVAKRLTVPTTSSIAARKRGERTVSEPRARMCTFSLAFSKNPALASIRSAVRDSPTPWFSGLSVFRPNAPARKIDARTAPSHPKIAILRCWALQRAARAVRFRPGMRGAFRGGPRCNDPRSVQDLVQEIVILPPGRELTVLRPRDSEALLDEHAFEQEEFLPYWAELWPSGVALAQAIGGRALKGARVVELGCGLGLPSIAAALAGGRVLATDWSPAALDLLAANAERNGVTLETAVVRWDAPDALLERAPFDLVLAADVLYEQRNVPVLAELLPRLGGDGRGGEVLLADPGRPPLEGFLAQTGTVWSRPPVYRLR